MDMLLEAADNGTQLTDEEIREEVDTFMFEVRASSNCTSSIPCVIIQLLQFEPMNALDFAKIKTIFSLNVDASLGSY